MLSYKTEGRPGLVALWRGNGAGQFLQPRSPHGTLIAIVTAGTWDDMAIELVQEIGRCTTVITQDIREPVLLFQRLSIAMQRRNVVSFLNTMNTE